MTKEKLEKEAEEWVNKNKPVQDDWEDSDIIQAIIDTSEPREKRIAELELKIKHITKHLEPQVMTALFEQVEEEVKQEQRIKKLEEENTRAGTDCISLVQDYEGNVIDIHERIKQAVLAGLKAGRPEWHKVSEQIPTEEKEYLVKLTDGTVDVMMVALDGDLEPYLLTPKSDFYKDVEKWCEIPPEE